MKYWWFRWSLATLIAVSVVPAVAQQRDPCVFEVASVKESVPRQRMTFSERPGARLQIRGYNLKWLVANAYGVGFHRVLEGPEWGARQRFDIEATSCNDQPVDGSRVQAMPRGLLADRFALRVRVEDREMPHYVLVRADLGGGVGAGIRPSTTDCDAWRAGRMGEGRPIAAVTTGSHCEQRFRLTDSASMEFDLGSQTMMEFVTVLRPHAGRLVLDTTGLEGRFDIGLEFLVDRSTSRQRRARAGGVFLFEALEQQLGLRLVSRTGPVEVIVIEHAERPSAN